MRQSVSLFLNLDGRRAGNAHDRRRIPPKREQQALARRWRRRAQDRRRYLLQFEAYDTWTGVFSGRVSEVRYSIEGQSYRHEVDAYFDPRALVDAIRSDPEAMLPAYGKLEALQHFPCWTAYNYGVHAQMENTVNLTWVHVVAGTSGAADVLPERFRLTGRPRK